ncbi:hypothetical protein COJ48_29370 [Bacillus cereus]|nr:hypothetical protein COJ48_29370 [Bacillus cereus]
MIYGLLLEFFLKKKCSCIKSLIKTVVLFVSILFIILDIVTMLNGFGIGCLGFVGYGLLILTILFSIGFATI